jgi:hypothetical protein
MGNRVEITQEITKLDSRNQPNGREILLFLYFYKVRRIGWACDLKTITHGSDPAM